MAEITLSCTQPSMDLDDGKGDMIRSFRDLAPADYALKIENFSLLRNAENEKLESGDFEASGYKWKLSLYPNGNKEKGGNDHISLYVVFSESNSLPPASQVFADIKLFVYDHIRDQYMVIRDAKGRVRRFNGRFHGMMKREWGVEKLIPLNTFNDPLKGYLINDCCIFGVEISVIKPSDRGECFSVKKPDDGTFTWDLRKFSTLVDDFYRSDSFAIGGYQWNLVVYPNGVISKRGKYLSVFLELKETYPAGDSSSEVYAELKFRVRDKILGRHAEKATYCRFGKAIKDWGFLTFLPLKDLKSAEKGLLVDDTLTVEVVITLLSTIKEFSGGLI